MMRKLGLFVAFLALATAPAGPALAQENWQRLGTSEGSRFTFYFNPDSVTRRGDIVLVWLKRDLAETRADGALYFISQAEIDCARQAARIMSVTSYTAQDRMISRDTAPARAEPIGEGSFFDAVRENVCERPDQ